MPLDFSQASGAPGVQRACWVQAWLQDHPTGLWSLQEASAGLEASCEGNFQSRNIQTLSRKAVSVPHLCGWAISKMCIYDLTSGF